MRRLLIFLPVLIALMLVPAPAFAGGPTSAILVEPASGRATALYTQDADYGALMSELGEGVQGEKLSPSSAWPGGTYVTVTWLIHDVSVWRIDRIFYAQSGGPVIVTQQSVDGTQQPVDAPAVRHRAQNGKALLAVLNRTIFAPADGKGAVTTVTAQAAPVTVTAPAAVVAPAAGPPATTAAGSSADWLWGAIGLAGGVLATLLIIQLLGLTRRRRARPADPGAPVFSGP